MKLAIFSDKGVGRYFAQLFDDLPSITFYLSEKNKSGLAVTKQPVRLLTKKEMLINAIKKPIKSIRRLAENHYDNKRDFYFNEIEKDLRNKCFDVALVAADRSLYTLASLKKRGYKFKLVYWIPFTIPFVDMFAERSLLIRKFSFSEVDLFVAITETCRQTLLLEGIPANKICQVYPGIDTQVFNLPQNKQKKKSPFRILFVGKLVSWKGVYSLIYAAKVLLRDIPDLEVVFVGRGAQKEGLEKLAALLGLSAHIKFMGFINYADIPAVYAEANVFVLPSLPAINIAEQFGFVVAEAMATGLPAIVANVGGLPEVVGRDSRLIFTPGDYRELADKILAIFKSPGLASELGVKCHARAQSCYSANKNGLSLYNALSKLVE